MGGLAGVNMAGVRLNDVKGSETSVQRMSRQPRPTFVSWRQDRLRTQLPKTVPDHSHCKQTARQYVRPPCYRGGGHLRCQRLGLVLPLVLVVVPSAVVVVRTTSRTAGSPRSL